MDGDVVNPTTMAKTASCTTKKRLGEKRTLMTLSRRRHPVKRLVEHNKNSPRYKILAKSPELLTRSCRDIIAVQAGLRIARVSLISLETARKTELTASRADEVVVADNSSRRSRQVSFIAILFGVLFAILAYVLSRGNVVLERRCLPHVP